MPSRVPEDTPQAQPAAHTYTHIYFKKFSLPAYYQRMWFKKELFSKNMLVSALERKHYIYNQIQTDFSCSARGQYGRFSNITSSSGSSKQHHFHVPTSNSTTNMQQAWDMIGIFSSLRFTEQWLVEHFCLVMLIMAWLQTVCQWSVISYYAERCRAPLPLRSVC